MIQRVDVMVADEPFDEINTIKGIMMIADTKDNESHVLCRDSLATYIQYFVELTIYCTILLLVDKENDVSEDDECCPILKMSSDGIATKIHSNKLGFYHSLETFHNNRIYQLKGSNKFLHRSSIGFWTVSDMFMLRIHSNQNLPLNSFVNSKVSVFNF